jgi:2-iminobutanoate/2-iminopropanoate deaminase
MSNAFCRSVVVSSVVLVSLLVPSAARSQATRQAVVPPGGSASATLTPGIKYGDVLYVSGQLGNARNAPDSTIQGETTRALERVKGVVEAAGSTMDKVLKCTVFLVNAADFQGMNQAYTKFFPKEPPARSTIVVAALVSAGAKVEIECIAALK